MVFTSRVACCLAAGAAAACSGSPEGNGGSLATTAAPIINGQADPGETGVVYITHKDYPFLCSGTVVHPKLVVTAKHCAFRERSGPDQPMAGDRFRVGFGPSAGNLTWRTTSRMEWIGMPGNVEVQQAVDAGEDIALLFLSSSVPAGTKVHGVKLDYFPSSGDELTIVGYGRSSLTSGAVGVKRATTDAFNGTDPTTGILQAKGKGACSGDSGGPFFFGAARQLVGVTSTAAGSSDTMFCDIGISNATSVRNGKVNTFLFDALGALGTCLQQPEVCGDGMDQDCDGVADNQCSPDGTPCSADVECKNGLCQDLGGGAVCVRLCDELTPCPATSRCVLTGCGTGYCEVGQQGSGKLEEACSDDRECASNHCSSEGCAGLCKPTLGECPDGKACSVSTGCGECLDLAAVVGPRWLGEQCDTTTDCDAEGECTDDGFGVRRCAMPCFEGEACPGGFLCRGGRCVRAGGFSNGDRCLHPDDCASFLCALVSGNPAGNFCTKKCSTGADCGTGFDCLMQFGDRICVPDGLLLGQSCVADSQCTSRRCDEGLGVCTRPCDPSSVACPPGFLCKVVSGELECVPGAGAWPSEPDGGPDADAHGGSSGGGGGGSAGVPPAGAGGVVRPDGAPGGLGGAENDVGDSVEDSGCGCRVAGELPERRGLAVVALAGLFTVVVRGRRKRRESRPVVRA